MLEEGGRLKPQSTVRIEVVVGVALRPQAEGVERKREYEATRQAEAEAEVVGVK